MAAVSFLHYQLSFALAHFMFSLLDFRLCRKMLKLKKRKSFGKKDLI